MSMQMSTEKKGVCVSDYLSVSSLTKYLKLKFDRDPYLERVYLTGQVSNFRRRPNHQYFSLKDEKAVIDYVVWYLQKTWFWVGRKAWRLMLSVVFFMSQVVLIPLLLKKLSQMG